MGKERERFGGDGGYFVRVVGLAWPDLVDTAQTLAARVGSAWFAPCPVLKAQLLQF